MSRRKSYINDRLKNYATHRIKCFGRRKKREKKNVLQLPCFVRGRALSACGWLWVIFWGIIKTTSRYQNHFKVSTVSDLRTRDKIVTYRGDVTRRDVTKALACRLCAERLNHDGQSCRKMAHCTINSKVGIFNLLCFTMMYSKNLTLQNEILWRETWTLTIKWT